MGKLISKTFKHEPKRSKLRTVTWGKREVFRQDTSIGREATLPNDRHIPVSMHGMDYIHG